jgi:hypothetical protein
MGRAQGQNMDTPRGYSLSANGRGFLPGRAQTGFVLPRSRPKAGSRWPGRWATYLDGLRAGPGRAGTTRQAQRPGQRSPADRRGRGFPNAAEVAALLGGRSAKRSNRSEEVRRAGLSCVAPGDSTGAGFLRKPERGRIFSRWTIQPSAQSERAGPPQGGGPASALPRSRHGDRRVFLFPWERTRPGVFLRCAP